MYVQQQIQTHCFQGDISPEQVNYEKEIIPQKEESLKLEL
jgi:hypothetical protein